MPRLDLVTTAHRPSASTPPAILASHWQVRLLGAVQVRCGDRGESRFASRAVALLLGRLASRPSHAHAREQLIELLWPGVPPSVGRARFRPVLSALRGLLEPAGWPGGCVLAADRLTVQWRQEALTCDVVEFEALVRLGRSAEAARAYGGEFMPGYYDDWVVEERERLAAWAETAAGGSGPAAGRSATDRAAGGDAVVVRFDRKDDRASRPAPSAPSPLSVQARSAVRLPVPLGSFFGRDAERSTLQAALASHRLVTVTGTGGCGKTRLAVEVAQAEAGRRRVAFVALAECDQAGDVVERIRAALDLPRGDAGNRAQLLNQIADAIDGAPALLLLDNYEQLVGAEGSAVLRSLLDRMPSLALLVTSRRALRLPGEQEFGLLPLPLPADDAALAETAANPSVALFVERARDVQHRFQLGRRNLAEIARLCRILEGLPLSLELAASKVRAYSIVEMANALQDSRDLLARRLRREGSAQRHDSLHAAIHWSWQLLDPALRRFAAALTVFRGGWTAAQAAAVADACDAHAWLEELVGDSLVLAAADETGVATRFGMLESVRLFARGELTGADAARFRGRHRACFVDLAAARGAFDTAGPGIDLPNHVAAIETALDDGAADQALALALSLRPCLHARGATPQICELLRQVAARLPPSTPAYGTLLCLLARVLVTAGEIEEARGCVARALALAGDDAGQRAEALHRQARIEWMMSRNAAVVGRLAQEAVDLARQAGRLALQADGIALLAAVELLGRRSAETAEALYRQAHALHRQVGDAGAAMLDRDGEISCLMLAPGSGGDPIARHAAVRRATEMARDCAREAGDAGLHEARIILLSHAGYGHAQLREYAPALAMEQRVVRLGREHHLVYYIGYSLWNQCVCLARLHRPQDAARMMAFSQRYWTERFVPLTAADRRHVDKVRRMVRLQIGQEALQQAWDEGAAWSVGEGLAAGCGTAIG